MSTLELMNKRLRWQGGKQEQRMQQDKLKSLKKALQYSYQACEIELENGWQFKALMNRDLFNHKRDEDIISIPYKDFALNDYNREYGEMDIPLSTGDVFYWINTNTYWLVYLEFEEEDAYFRAKTKRCNGQITINNQLYRFVKSDNLAETLKWRENNNLKNNSLTYVSSIYIKKNQDTYDFFQKGKIFELDDNEYSGPKKWHVLGRNNDYGNGIFEIFIEEYYQNTIQDEIDNKPIPPTPQSYIIGERRVDMYADYEYCIQNMSDGIWKLFYNDKLLEQRKDTDGKFTISFGNYKKGVYTLRYYTQTQYEQIEILMKRT